MPQSYDVPDLTHWKHVMEFSVEAAALLLAGIDPLDIETVSAAKELDHPRWKQAQALMLAIVSAIRQGVISPIICRSFHQIESYPYDEIHIETLKPTDRSREISPPHTIIARASLENWVRSEQVQFAKPKSLKTVTAPAFQQAPATHVITEPATTKEPLALPYHGHKSEGL